MSRSKKVASHVLATVSVTGWFFEKLQDCLLPEEYNIKSGTLKGIHDLSHSVGDIEYLFNLNKLRADKFYKDGVDPLLYVKKSFANIYDIGLGAPIWINLTNSLIGFPVWVPLYMQTTSFMRFGWDLLYIGKSFSSKAAEVSEKYDPEEALKFRRIENKFERANKGLKMITQAFDYMNHREIVEWWRNRGYKNENFGDDEQKVKSKLDSRQKLRMYGDIAIGESKLFAEFWYKILQHWRLQYKNKEKENFRELVSEEYRRKQRNIYVDL